MDVDNAERRRTGAGAFGLRVVLAVLLFTMAGVAGMVAPAKAFADFELSIYTAAERNSPAVEGLLRFVQLVEDRTNDRVQFDFFHGGSWGSHEEAVDDLRVGALDIVLAPLSAFAELYPRVVTLTAPHLFRDEVHLQEVIHGPVGRRLLSQLERSGVKGLAFLDGGFRYLGLVGRSVRQVEDLAGLKVAVQGDLDVQVWYALGAEPVPAPWHESRTRLEQGDVQAYHATPEMMHRAGLQEVVDHYSLVGHGWMGYLLAVNQWLWKDLPVGIRQVMQEAARDVGSWSSMRWAQVNERSLAALESAGVYIERNPDLASFHEKADEFYAAAKDSPSLDRALVRQIRAVGEDADEDRGA